LPCFLLRDRIRLQGSPSSASTFVDEAANGTAAEIAAKLHRSTWTVRFFQQWQRVRAGKRKLD
jgi:hypothetical protein